MDSEQTTTTIDPALRERIRSSRSLPSPPAVAARLIEIADDPNVGLNDIFEVLKTDPVLSARLLRLANSPLYARRRRTETLQQAVMKLGIDAVLTAALSLTLFSDQSAFGADGLSFQSQWTSSVHAAVSAQVLASQCLLVTPSDAFLAALVQEIGILVIDRLESETYAELDSTATHEDIVAAEFATLGADHAAIGAELLEAWRLPSHIVAAVRQSHVVADEPTTGDALACIVATGRLIAEWIGGDVKALSRAGIMAETALHLDDQMMSDVLTGVAESLPDLAPLLHADVPPLELLAEMAGDVMVARQMQQREAVSQLQRDLAHLTNVTAELELAHRLDPVTGLFNRRHLDEALADEHRLAAELGVPLSVLFVDLDYFKSVNDCLGHHGGDSVLQQAAQRVMDAVRSEDLVGRYGGDEFVVVLPGTNLEAAEIVASRIVEVFRREALGIDGHEWPQTVTIGVACTQSPHGEAGLASLLQDADAALYHAKLRGRNGWRSAPHDHEEPTPLPPIVYSSTW
ncbi:MAG: GGDEF domain-containing protein [Ilumatobacter sp.]|uniref:GGDEF domain-containing protein n=1 Tax=Ilumatobacter sp. TaxID=1967498 RepID=UPI00260424C4|nr:GGDEF domain-containing protein [Ilumatobacter sp.]MDJ0767466.1 GGDEF domain-containing protein [Ilumatobacter sp.]